MIDVLRSIRLSHLFLAGVFLTLLLSGITRFEPAPYDILLLLVWSFGLIVGVWRLPLPLKADPPTVIALIGTGLLIVFVLINVINIAIASKSIHSVIYGGITIYLALTTIFFWGTLYTYGLRGLKIITRGYLIAAVMSALVAIVGSLGLQPFYELFTTFDGRATALFKDPNVLSPFLVPIALYAFLQVTYSWRTSHKVAWLGAFIVLATGVLLSYSRAGWLNLGLSFVLFILLSGLIVWRPQIVVLVFGLLISTVSVVFLNPYLRSFILSRFGLASYDIDRFSNQQLALELALENPAGLGPGQAESVLDFAVHNLYLRVLLENGWAGLLVLLLVFSLTIGFVTWRAITKRGSAKMYYAFVAAALVGQMINSLVIDSLHWRHLFLLLALAWVKDETATLLDNSR
jgi:O-antigen ligase